MHPPTSVDPLPRRPGRDFFTASRLHGPKRLDLLIRSMRRVVDECPTATLDIVGRGQDEPRLRALATQLGGGKVEVWNLGVPHFGPQQSFLQLFDRWDEIQPRVVVLTHSSGGRSAVKVLDGLARELRGAEVSASG